MSLEKLYAFVKNEFPFEDIERKLDCYIFKDRREYYRFCVEISGWTLERAARTGGHANARYYATFYQSPTANVVMHEATHQIVGACLKVPGVGSWFQEGMAVYIEKKIGNTGPSQGMRNDLKRGQYHPLSEFVAIQSLLFAPGDLGRRNYRHAGALIDFMVNTKLEPVAGGFQEFLAATRRGRGFGRGKSFTEKLVLEVYGLSLDELEVLWRKHHKLR